MVIVLCTQKIEEKSITQPKPPSPVEKSKKQSPPSNETKPINQTVLNPTPPSKPKTIPTPPSKPVHAPRQSPSPDIVIAPKTPAHEVIVKHKRPVTPGERSSTSGERTTTTSGESESQQLSSSESESESDIDMDVSNV